MSMKLSALVAASNGIYDRCHTFNNTFRAQAHQLKQELTAIKDKLLADGQYANFNAAKADILNQATGASATAMTEVFTQVASVFAKLNALNNTDTVTLQMDAIKELMLAIDTAVKSIDRV
jgi:hypothetical protein